jgi:hypothetical protein
VPEASRWQPVSSSWWTVGTGWYMGEIWATKQVGIWAQSIGSLLPYKGVRVIPGLTLQWQTVLRPKKTNQAPAHTPWPDTIKIPKMHQSCDVIWLRGAPSLLMLNAFCKNSIISQGIFGNGNIYCIWLRGAPSLLRLNAFCKNSVISQGIFGNVNIYCM